jgi:chemotaxis methyl-accepting protein methylase/nitrogen-specific signal transduction histidine kinase
MSENAFVSMSPLLEAPDGPSEPLGHADLSQILRSVADHSGHDLTPYRRGPILRRLERRARESRLGSLADYAWVLRRTPAELDALLPCLLGRSSRFFRAPAQLAALRSMVLEPLLGLRSPEDPFRVWIIGCSTGEEAYSIAMLLLEVADSAPASGIEIIATDVDPGSIEVARRGAYGPRIARAVAAGRLERFFVPEESGYRVSADVRKRILFSTHDPLLDPPFPDLDLIVCRSLLDSLKPAPRREVLSRLQAGLKPGGSLLIGPSETRPLPASCFSRTEARQRLFLRTASETRAGEAAADGPGGELRSTNAQLEAVNVGLRGRLEGLAAANADLKTLLGNTRIALLLDADLRVRSFTRATRSLFQISEADRGRGIDELPRRFTHEGLADRILRGSDVQAGLEDEVLADDGRSFAMRTLAHRTATGAVAGWLVTFVDVTARKAAEDMVSQSREFVASISHELRTPLHAIIGYADLLREEGSESHLHMLDGIRRSADGLLDIVGALLDLSRLDHIPTAPRVECIAVSSLIGEVIGEVQAGHGRAAPRIRLELVADVPDLFTDSLRLRIALRNVLDNAVKHGRTDVRVDIRPSEAGVEFSVSDRGPGIPLAEQEHVFEAFHQGETAVRRGADGFGLGLYVTRRLVESLGGSIELESEPGSRSTFRLWIPSRIGPLVEPQSTEGAA